MTGAYLFAVRDGERTPVEVEHLTDEERYEHFINRPPAELVRWLNMTCNKLAELQPLLDQLESEGILQRQ